MAARLHVPGKNVAKSVVIRCEQGFALAVLQAPRQVDVDKTCEALHSRSVELADEEELPQLFGDCELGAIPPFGSQYGLKTLVDENLADDEYIVFEGNTHEQAFSMRFADYARIEHPTVAPIA
jgi:Ala-tRNA(Pro) deacylase